VIYAHNDDDDDARYLNTFDPSVCECQTDRVEDGRSRISSIDCDVIDVVDGVHAVVNRDQYVVLRARQRRFTHLSNNLDQQRVVVEYGVVVQRVIASFSHKVTHAKKHRLVIVNHRYQLGMLYPKKGNNCSK